MQLLRIFWLANSLQPSKAITQPTDYQVICCQTTDELSLLHLHRVYKYKIIWKYLKHEQN
jgi:hypothetical protein